MLEMIILLIHANIFISSAFAFFDALPFPFLSTKFLELNPADHPHVMSLLYASVIIGSNMIFVTNFHCILASLISLMQVG